MTKKDSKRTLTPVNQVIEEVMRRLDLPDDATEKGKVFLAWEEAAGEASAHTHPFRFRGSVLIVEVRNPAWMNELILRKSDILARLERAAGKRIVTDLRFQLKRPRE